jgi:sigma-54 specific flagellar transcriptional regulator A
LPPLRERRGDIAPLFHHFWKQHGEERPVTSAVMRRLESYDWPGNVRELENLVERLSVCAQGHIIEMAHLPASFLEVHDSGPLDKAGEGSRLAGEASHEIWADLDGVPAAISACERSELLDATVRRGPVAMAPDAAEDVSAHGGTAPALSLPANLSLPVDLPNLLRMLEESYIRLALEQSGGNKKEAARLLGLGRTTLVEKLRRRAADVSAP